MQVFPAVGEVYQATEGFLAASCAHGTLHLNEEFCISNRSGSTSSVLRR